MDGSVPGVEPLESYGLVAAPHAGSNDAWCATLCPHRIAEVISTIGTIGKHLAWIIRQGIGSGLAIVDIGRSDGDLFHQCRIGIGADMRLGR